jgi:hypothetical protein
VELETLSKLAGLAGAIFGLYKLFIEVSRSKKPELRDEYAFVKTYVGELTSTTHPYIVEKGYAAISGDSSLKAPEILHLISRPAPSTSLRLYARAKDLLEFYPDDPERPIKFSGQHRSARARAWKKRGYVSLYIIFASLAIGPLLFFGAIQKDWTQQLQLTLLAPLAFGVPAWSSLVAYGRCIAAEHLIGSYGEA